MSVNLGCFDCGSELVYRAVPGRAKGMACPKCDPPMSASPQPATTDALTALIEAAKLARYRLPCICRGFGIRCSRCALDAAIRDAEASKGVK